MQKIDEMKSFGWKPSEINWSKKMEEKCYWIFSYTNTVTQRQLSHYRTNSCQLSDWCMTTIVGKRHFNVTGVVNIHFAAVGVRKQLDQLVDQAKCQSSIAGFNVCLWFVFWIRVGVARDRRPNEGGYVHTFDNFPARPEVVRPVPKVSMDFRRHNADEREHLTLFQTKWTQNTAPLQQHMLIY